MGNEDHEIRTVPWDKKPTSKVAEFAKRPAVWLGMVLVGAMATGFTAWIEPRVGGFLDGITENGEFVEVSAQLRHTGNNVWLPEPLDIDETQRTELEAMDTIDQHQWLLDQGGISFGIKELEMEVRGNRSDTVRIVDVRPISECGDFTDGALVQLYPPMGGTVAVVNMDVDVEKPEQPPQLSHYEATRGDPPVGPGNYFDSKTITLEKDETEFMLVGLRSYDEVCSVDLELTMMVGGKRHTQRVLGEGNEVVIAPMNYEPARPHITGYFIGGDACPTYYSVHPGALHRLMLTNCGHSIPEWNLTTKPAPTYPGT